MQKDLEYGCSDLCLTTMYQYFRAYHVKQVSKQTRLLVHNVMEQMAA